MTSYARVAVTGSVVEGPPQQQQRQQSPKGDRFNGAFGARRAWWWQAGPVDSCCFCFSLGTGVALTAMGRLLSGIWGFFSDRVYEAYTIDSLEMSQEQYARSCEGSAASTTVACMQLKANMEQADGFLGVLRHYPMVAYVQAVLSIVAGVFGLWAVFFKHTRAAEVYMLTRAAKIFVAVWAALEMRSLCAKYDVEQGYIGSIYLITSFIMLYELKVAWSYYKRRLEYSYDAPPSRRGAASDTANHATPMLAMDTTV